MASRTMDSPPIVASPISRLFSPSTTGLPEAAGADERGNDNHGKSHHDCLVESSHDRRQGKRYLDPAQDLPVCCPKGNGRFNEFGMDLADSQAGEPE